jgi:hypothetical protein
VTGKPQPRTLKLKGVIKDRNITILVDSGSTHNCIDIDVAKKLNYFIYPTRDLTIKVANGQRVKEVGKCHKISVQIQELELQTGFYALPLEGMDMVLGAEWLIQLGSYATNLEEQFMEFNWQGQHYKLYGVKGSTLKKNQLPPTEKNFISLQKHAQLERILFYYALRTKHPLRGWQCYKHKMNIIT